MIIAGLSILFSTYLFFGVYVLSLNSRDRLNRIFFLIALLFALICFLAIFHQIPLLNKNNQLWYKLQCTLYSFNLYLILIFNARLTRTSKPVWYLVFFLSLPVLYISIQIFFFPSELLTFYNKSNITYLYGYTDRGNTLLNQISIINLLNTFLSILILILGYRKASSRRIKKQIIIILLTLALTVIITFIDWGIIFQFSDNPNTRRIPGLPVIYSLIWIFGIWYSLVKYRFLSIDKAALCQNVVSNIDEMVVLLNTDFHILTVNRKLKETINSEENLYGKHMSYLIHEHETIAGELQEHQADNEISFSCRINFIDREQDRICVDSKIKMFKDKFKDIIGYLIIAKEIKELKQLREIYKITYREASVIQSVIAGRTNHEIAEELGITERTVKSHMTHIFNKLGIDNRIQLLIKLKDFNLIPEVQADKILFLKQME
jgi:DNA-binding CsgD family transcriptional regulator/PAS domain-containing protein